MKSTPFLAGVAAALLLSACDQPAPWARAAVAPQPSQAVRNERAQAVAWNEGMRRLDEAIAEGRSHALETTLGGASMTARLREASRTHDVLIWFCGLATPELHLRRVRKRVAAGGHDIPEAKIRERWTASIAHLIALLPHLAEVRLFDNSASAAPGEVVPDPLPVAVFREGKLIWPLSDDLEQLARTPDWAKPVLEAGLPAR
mgnify:CR=1 FL=1